MDKEFIAFQVVWFALWPVAYFYEVEHPTWTGIVGLAGGPQGHNRVSPITYCTGSAQPIAQRDFIFLISC